MPNKLTKNVREETHIYVKILSLPVISVTLTKRFFQSMKKHINIYISMLELVPYGADGRQDRCKSKAQPY